MHRAARLSAILERLADGGSVAVADLADDLDASHGTIRRDLVILEKQHLLARTYGGATAHAVSYELPLRYKSVRHAEEKRSIAREAAEQVSEGMAVGLTGGTTATEVARALADRQKLTIVTNALNIASELALRPGIKLITTGGVARSQSYELSGPIAEASLTGLNLNVAFIGVDGIDPQAGCTTHHEVEAHTNAVMINCARRVVVVADSSKIGKIAFARICEVGAVSELITDAAADADAIRALTDCGVHVTLAGEGRGGAAAGGR
jgi:DeoR family transcriptional regulator of aga operon